MRRNPIETFKDLGMNQPTTPDTAEDFLPLPTNDEVYAEVCRGREGMILYISKEGVSDVMAAVRRLVPAAPSVTPAAPVVAEGLDDLIERAALTHVAPLFQQIGRPDDDYRKTNQFARLKAFTLDLLAAHPVAGSPAEAEPDELDKWMAGMCAEDRAEIEKARAELLAMPIEEVSKMVRGMFVNVVAAPVPASEAASVPEGDSYKPVYWFSVLAKCARLLDLPDDEPIPSGVLKAVEGLVAAPAAPTDALPYNWKPTPYEATEAMVSAAKQQDPALTVSDVRALWSSMWKVVAAAPTDAKPDGINIAADYIDKKAGEYIKENASTEHDTGAVSWHYGDAGRDYYSTLVELAEEIRGLNAPIAAQSVRDAAQPTKGDAS